MLHLPHWFPVMSTSPLVFRPSTGPEHPRWTETLHDHRHVLIRPIAPQDKAAERTFIEALSARSRRHRLLGALHSPSERLIEQLTDIDHVHEVAFVAVVKDDSQERIVGACRYSTDVDGRNCECVVMVSDEWQKQGLGTLLMKHLIDVARSRGIRRMTSLNSAQNIQMQDLMHNLGFRTRVDLVDAGRVIHELDL